MQSINPDNELNDLNSALLVAPAYARGYKDSLMSTMEFYQKLRNYINEHPEYYVCSTT